MPYYYYDRRQRRSYALVMRMSCVVLNWFLLGCYNAVWHKWCFQNMTVLSHSGACLCEVVCLCIAGCLWASARVGWWGTGRLDKECVEKVVPMATAFALGLRNTGTSFNLSNLKYCVRSCFVTDRSTKLKNAIACRVPVRCFKLTMSSPV